MSDTTEAIQTTEESTPAHQGDGATQAVAAPGAPPPSPGAAALVPQTYEQVERFSNLVSRSQLVPKQYRGQPADIMVAVMTGREIGLKPLQALQNIAVINGKPSIYGDAAIALVRASGACAEINEEIRGEGDQMEARCYACRSDTGEEGHHTFSVADAKKANLWGKRGPWSSYPQRMLQMRARSWVLRDLFADVLQGLYIAEEARDIPSEDEKRNAKYEKLLADMRQRLEEANPAAFEAAMRQCEDYVANWPREQQGKAEALFADVRGARGDVQAEAPKQIEQPGEAAEGTPDEITEEAPAEVSPEAFASALSEAAAQYETAEGKTGAVNEVASKWDPHLGDLSDEERAPYNEAFHAAIVEAKGAGDASAAADDILDGNTALDKGEGED